MNTKKNFEGTNYFQFHGCQIWDKTRKIVEKAEMWGEEYSLKKHELLTTGEFDTTDFSAHATFVSGGKLYMFLSGSFTGSIVSFFELNTSPKKCVSGNCGVYYEIVKA